MQDAAAVRPIATPQAALQLPKPASAPALDLQMLAEDLKRAIAEAKGEQLVPAKSQVKEVVQNKHLLPQCVSCQSFGLYRAIYIYIC